jgi:hypothetical protein
MKTRPLFFECSFPYVCPEPVLAKRSHFIYECLKKTVFVRAYPALTKLAARSSTVAKQTKRTRAQKEKVSDAFFWLELYQ